MSAMGKRKHVERGAGDVESSDVPAEVANSGVRLSERLTGEPEGVAALTAAVAEESTLGRLLFGWGTLLTVVGMLGGGLWVGPLGALLGAVLGSTIGIATVAVVVARRSKSAPPTATDEEGSP